MVDVKHLAKLSKIALTDEEIKRYEVQLSQTIDMIENMPDFTIQKPCLDPKKAMELREDVVENKFKREEILKNAPQLKAGCIVVPKVMEE